jgi:GntR family transcriptional regulator / MocR family aminotransferase
MQLPILLDRETRVPLQRQLYDSIRRMVLTRGLRPGDRLPASRGLAKALDVSRVTVTLAYEQLTAEGYLQARRGAGTFVSTQIPDALGEAHGRSVPRVAQARVRVSKYADRLQEEPAVGEVPPAAIDLSCFAPDFDRFPMAEWRRTLSRRLRSSGKRLFQYAGDAYGYEPLRQAIATYVAKSRAIQCTAAQVLIVSGSQQALDLCARVLIDQEDSVGIENPGYPGTHGVFQAHGARVHTVPVDGDGIVVRRLKPGARIIYTTPSHQFPTGASMSIARRMQLIDWARQHGSTLIEDDYDSEYRYHGAPLPALYGLAGDVPVVYIGTFSKVMYPGIRLGYLIATDALAQRFAAAKWTMDRHSSLLEQMALADFIKEGHLERHVRRMRRLYHQRRTALVSALDQHFGEAAEILGDQAGMHILVRFRNLEREPDPARDGVRLTSASKYYFSNAPANDYVMGFTAVTERALREGVSRLRRAWSHPRSKRSLGGEF